ncbi:MAG: polysaccharide pyruvyl transferase family protein [Verrucomicrobiota bacterium]
MGVGWWQYQDPPDWRSWFLWMAALSWRHLHSVRDEYTRSKLAAMGLRNVINTGCPTMWPFLDFDQSTIPVTKAENALLMLTDYFLAARGRRSADQAAAGQLPHGLLLAARPARPRLHPRARPARALPGAHLRLAEEISGQRHAGRLHRHPAARRRLLPPARQAFPHRGSGQPRHRNRKGHRAAHGEARRPGDPPPLDRGLGRFPPSASTAPRSKSGAASSASPAA